MSGLAVIFNLDGRPIDRALFGGMMDAIAHRGPDGCGHWIDGPIALGYQAFHTTPEAVHETQPLADPAGRLRLVFDGRIDNREELAAALRERNAAPRDDTDAELALRTYQCFGAEAPERIIGDFAMVVWDSLKRELFCARDPIGVRTFHYFCDGRTLLAATELQQLFADPAMPAEPDEGVVGEYLSGTLVGRADTLFKHIKRLPAAYRMVVRAEGLKITPWFDLLPQNELRYRDDAEYAEHFREIFGAAVRCRMRAIGPIGAHLSGGLDSTSVVGMVAALRRSGKAPDCPFETFSLRFEHPDLDERAHVDATVRMLDLRSNSPEPYAITLDDCVRSVGRYRDFSEYPNGALWFNLWAAARERGFRVLLSGTGSDEWMSGTPYAYADLLCSGRLREMRRRIRADSATPPGVANRNQIDFALRRAVWPLLPERLRALTRRALGRTPVPDFIRPGFARRIGLVERLESDPRPPIAMSFARRALYENFHSGWVAHGMDMSNRLTAAWTIEERHPFHDRRLYEFLMSVPDDQPARERTRKFILRNALRGLIPDSVLARRDKADFSILFVKALKQFAGDQGFNAAALAEAGWIDAAAFRRAWRERIADYQNANIWPLWTTVSAELWRRNAVNRADAASAAAG